MRKKWIWLVLLLVLALLAGICLKYYTDRYAWAAGASIPLDAKQADLRGRKMTRGQFDALQEKLPDCDILWDVPIFGSTAPSNTQALQTVSLTEADAAALEYFPELALLDASGCTDYDLLLPFAEAHPECTVIWQVELDGKTYDNDAASLLLKNPDAAELTQALSCLPQMERVKLTGDLPEIEALEDLRETFPKVSFLWEFSYEGRTLTNGSPRADVSDIPLTYKEAEELLRWLPDTQAINMRGCGLTDKEMRKLCDSHPENDLYWDMTFLDTTIFTGAAEIDISNRQMESTDEIEELLPYLPNAKKIIMSHCGFDDETMDALNKRHQDIRFVWSVKIKNVYVRTDATYFYPFKFDKDMQVNNKDVYPLRYCTDMIAIDLGHQWGVTDCEWAAFMPNLTYLILVETQILDLSPLSELKNLIYLEIFKTRITDYSPLVSCTSLVDLNLCRTYGDYRPLLEMTWLENVWWNGIAGVIDRPCTGAPDALREALPNTRLVFNQFNSAERNGWRQFSHYRDMRDVMGMFYLQ